MRPMTCSRILSLSLLEQLQQDSLNSPYLKFRGLNEKHTLPETLYFGEISESPPPLSISMSL